VLPDPDADRHVTRLGVLDDVVDGLGHDAVDVLGHVRRDLVEGAPDAEAEPQPGPVGRALRQCPHGLRQAELGRRRRSQLVHHRPEVRQYGLREQPDLVRDPPHALRGDARPARTEDLHRLGLHADGEHLLHDRVVQVARQPLTLLAAGELPLVLQERGVVDRHGGLLGHGQQELEVALPDHLARREEGVEDPRRPTPDDEGDAGEPAPVELGEVVAHRLPRGVALDHVPAVRDHDGLAELERLDHLQGGAAFPALHEPLEEVRPASETCRAHDLQTGTRLVEGEDLHSRQRIGLEDLTRQCVQGRGDRALRRHLHRRTGDGRDPALAMPLGSDVAEGDDGPAGRLRERTGPVRELPVHPGHGRPGADLFGGAVVEQPQ
jgi:hypothetical protein